MTFETPEPSDQLPEEAPAEQAQDDEGSSSESAQKQAREEADVREGEEQATGDRKSAG